MRRFSSRHLFVLIATSAAAPKPAIAQPGGAPGDGAPPSPPAAPPSEAEAPSDDSAGSPEDDPGEEVAPETGTDDEVDAAPEAEAVDEDELSPEDLAELEGEDPARPAPQGKGVVWGVLTDTKLGEPLIEATVSVVGTKLEAVTDYEGRFRLELPPGSYAVRFFYELHKPARFDGIKVELGKVGRFDAKLDPEEDAIDTIEIESEVTRTTIEGEILTRQRSAAVGDSLGRMEISKSPDRNAAQAAQRVVGANVVGGRFVYVRGLGERYTNALLNGVPLPSPEPDRAAVPLDLFPTAVVNSLTIAKTFTPDVPADFAGGSVRIESREIPGSFLLQTSISGGYNTQSTFKERLTHRGGDLDWLGFDDGTRALPDGFPKYKQSSGTLKPDGTRVTDEELARTGRSLNSYMTPVGSTTPPDHGGSVVIGNGWDLPGGRKIGFIGSLNYNRSYTVRENEIRRIFQESPGDNSEGVIARDYEMTSGNDNVTWGAFASVSYRLHEHHKLSLIGIHTTSADDQTFIVNGFHQTRNADIYNTRLSFITRSLESGQLAGEHEFPALGGAQINWNLSLSHASRDQPDTRDTVWQQPPGGVWRAIDVQEAGRHYFAEQGETQVGGGLDWAQPLTRTDRVDTDSKLKFGGLVSVRSRDFTSRTLRFRPIGQSNPILRCESESQLADCTDALFRSANIDEGGPLEFEEVTISRDSYDADLNVYAGYVMADVSLSKRFRLVLGERVEHTLQTVQPYDQFGIEKDLDGARISQTDLLPALSFVWSLDDRNKIRASLTRTLARPQLRELAPGIFSDFFGGRSQTGNVDLEITRIINADLRYEYFPTLREVLAMSVFFKQFADPIEPIVTLTSADDGLVTYRNAEKANLYGLELEARKDLDFVAPAMKDFSLVTNLTLATSTIEVGQERKLALTNQKRPLVNQAPYVYNLALDYTNESSGTTARLLYNVVGPTIIEVGTKSSEASAGLDDAYLHQRHLLDLTLQQDVGDKLELKFSIKNLLNAPYKVTQGCGRETGSDAISRPKQGLFDSTWRLSCDASEDTITRRYTEGISFSLGGSYTF